MAELKMSREFFLEASACKTADELLKLCADKGVELTKDEAEKFLAQVKEGEISLDRVDTVNGGQFCIGAVSIPCVGIGV